MSELSESEIRLGESDGFRRSQVQQLCDVLAQLHGELAVLRSRIVAPAEKDSRDEKIAELEELVRCKDEQIVEQSNTIVALRAGHGG